MLKQRANAKHVIRVAHRNAGAHTIRAHDVGHALGRLRCIGTLGLRDQILLRETPPGKVVPSHAALAEIRVLSRSARRDDDRSQALPEQIEAVIEPGAVDGRGTSGVLSGAEYNNRVRLVRGRFTRGADDAKSRESQKQKKRTGPGQQ